MNIDSSNIIRTRHSNADPDNDHLRLNPGIPQRKPRSVGKLCLWSLILAIVLFGGIALYSFLSHLFYGIRHPHRAMYHDTSEGKVEDWSKVVQPMIRKDSKFDVVASVWIRDEEGKDGVVDVDGEERMERLIYTGRVFEGVDMSGSAFANVTLRVPTSYFKNANLSNYDLRASFVLAQSSSNRPSWLNFVKNYTSWKPQDLKMPNLRKSNPEATLEDQIYDSFGFTIPLIEFHNITSTKPTTDNTATENLKTLTSQDVQSDSVEDDEPDWEDEETTTGSEMGISKPRNATNDKNRNTFKLEFIGDKRPVTEYHPYIVTRTHIRLAEQDKLLKRLPYIKAQKELANKTCIHEAKEPIKDSKWYQCDRSYRNSGVFETKVQIQLPSEDAEGKKGNKKSRMEWLYAPYLSAVPHAAGPKELVPIPIDRTDLTLLENPEPLASDEEHVTVTWKLSFSSHELGKLSWLPLKMANIYNMTKPDNELEHLQHAHDNTIGFLGYRIDEEAHPRRKHAFIFTSIIISIIRWFLTVRYWYTRTSTIGISRTGTAFLALWRFVYATEKIFVLVLQPSTNKTWLSKFPAVLDYIFSLIPPLVMLMAVLRIEFSWSAKEKRGGRGDETEKKGWIPRVYFVKATHSERLSERIEARVSIKAKLLLFTILFAAAYFFAASETYILSPRFPKASIPHPLEPLSPHIPTIMKYVKSLSGSSHMTGAVLQFIMNASSRTYAGNYKFATTLTLITRVLLCLDVVPRIVGKTVRTHGVGVDEGILLVIAIVDFVQALRYRNVRDEDAEDVE